MIDTYSESSQKGKLLQIGIQRRRLHENMSIITDFFENFIRRVKLKIFYICDVC